MSRRGLALIVVVGVLGTLAVLAAAFVTMAQLERKASRQRVHGFKAYLLARSGIEDAMARLARDQDPVYLGEDWNGNGILDTTGAAVIEKASEVYKIGTLNTDDCPVRDALRPSFFVAQASDLPATVPVDGRQRGYSGALAGDWAAHGNTYALKVSVTGTGEGFYVNGGDPSQPSTAGYNAVLRRMLGVLAEAIDREPGTGGNNGVPVGDADGWNLIDLRPADGWRDFKQIRDVALGGSQTKLDALQPYLTLTSWTDKHVIAPNARAAMVAGSASGTFYQSWADIKMAHETYPSVPGTSAPDFERIPVLAFGVNVGRAPVDLAWARTRKDALIALLGGLQGCYLDETKANNLAFGNPLSDYVGILRTAEIRNNWDDAAPKDDTHLIVDQIMASTSDLSTWQRWNDFCDTLAVTAWHPWVNTAANWTQADPTAISALMQAKRDILKANFNPNSDLNKFNPNPSLWKSVDKSDLVPPAYSTEFALAPQASSAREISCVGRVLGKNGKLLAERVLTAALTPPSVARLSTQREFACEGLGSLDLPGDEGAPRIPGQAGTPYLGVSNGVTATWGHTFPGLIGPDAAHGGAGLQVYPEPYANPGSGLGLNAADYDGNLQLATLETPDNDFYGVTGTATSQMMMLARYDDSLDLDVTASSAVGADLNQVDVNQVTQGELGHSLLDKTKPNSLYPDGCYAEKGRVPAYVDKGNANGFHGVLSFWFKPSYDDYPTTARWHQYLQWANVARPGFSSQWFAMWDHPLEFWKGLAFWGGVDTNRTGITHGGFSDQFTECATAPPRTFLPRRWYLVTQFYDMQGFLPQEVQALLLDAGGAPADQGAQYSVYASGAFWNPFDFATDITQDDGYGPHRIALGPLVVTRPAHTPVKEDLGEYSGPDATLDEFTLYDFGGRNPTSTTDYTPTPRAILDSPGTLASNRYPEGRYYKGWYYHKLTDPPAPDQAADYFTAPFTFPAGAQLQKITWTWYRPSGLPKDYAEIELVNRDGTDYLDGNEIASRSTLAPGQSTDQQDWTLRRALTGAPFRVHVVFRRPTDASGAPMVDANTPLLDSPILDDLTLYYWTQGPTGISTWSEGE